MRGPRVFVDREECTDDQLRDAHADGTDHQNLSSTPPVHEHDGWDSTEEVYNAYNTSGEQIHRVAC